MVQKYTRKLYVELKKNKAFNTWILFKNDEQSIESREKIKHKMYSGSA